MLKWKVGDVTVTQVVEQEMTFHCSNLIPTATSEEIQKIAWLAPHFIDAKGKLRLSIHALVVETKTNRIVVDTCMGNDKPRAMAGGNMLKIPFLERLAEAGYQRESIDTVLCTHLHIDHVGWNTMLVDGRWVPTFPRARYLLGRTEFNYWRDQQELPDDRVVFGDSVQPVFDAGLVDLVDNNHRINDEVSLVPTPGHTPGHASVRIQSRGEEAFITGDMIHHPCQMSRPEWAAYVDYDQDASTKMRRSVFSDLAQRPVLVIGTHFAAPTAGRIVRDGDAFRFEV